MTYAYSELLEISGNWAAIFTAAVATFAYCRYLSSQRRQKLAIEKHLLSEKQSGGDKGQRTVMHLTAHLSLTEQQVIAAAFRSKKIKTVVSVNDKKHAKHLMFEHCG